MVVVCSLIGVVTQIFGVVFVLLIWAVAHSKRSKIRAQPRTFVPNEASARPAEQWRPAVRLNSSCGACGKQFLQSDKFCGSCGSPRSSAVASADSAVVSTTVAQVNSPQATSERDAIHCPKCGGT
jgi:hypothetical protein